ncbi:CD109 antigen-like protein [Dinothrombium tinctorium]|uniref:TEP1-F n=1 Tax=Dinothrombium tinctorium TaxID=1965070 RepID=A0A3S3PF12_9ACAR|nr:CD109 antigen-like protein [Dinothrombium tinctorium]
MNRSLFCPLFVFAVFAYLSPTVRPADYFILASRTIRPGQVYQVSATVYRTPVPITVRASIQRNGVELSSASQQCKAQIPETLLLRIPPTSMPGDYKLRVEGNLNGVLGGTAFLNETHLHFSQRSMTIFVTTDKPIYKQGQTVRFRCIPITTDLKAFSDAIDVFVLDPRGNVMKRWLSRQSNLGAVSLEYPLSDQPLYGNWSIKVIAQGQEETKQFLVEEYYQTRFEVNVSMPAFFLTTDEYVYGSIMANFTSGIPVSGNLTILVTIEPSKPVGTSRFDQPPAIEHTKKLFNGYTEFQFEILSLAKLIGSSNLDGAKVTVNAYVGERFLNLVYNGYARAYIFGSKISLTSLGSTPQVFKPAMPVKAYFALSYHDGSRLPPEMLRHNKLNITPIVHFVGSTRYLETRSFAMSQYNPGIWEVQINLRTELNEKRDFSHVKSLRLDAVYTDEHNVRTNAFIDFYPTFAPSNRLIQVSTSTREPKVGEYIIFHVRANYYVDLFSYVIISKGVLLLSSREEMTSSIKTFAVTLSAEMAPLATIVVYDIARGDEVLADSLTFSVNGISRNKFSVTLSNRKDKSGETVEVDIRGQPGTYIALSAMDKDLFALDAGNQINNADVLRKMNSFDLQSNATLTHVWISKEGRIDQFLHFPSPTYGIDANKTFEYAGLIVFTDANVTRRADICNETAGFKSCLDGTQCYHVSKECNNRKDCNDGSDESNCNRRDALELSQFRIYRSNRLQRLYDNTWLWKDINIGPLGYYIFSVPVPKTPALWIINAFGMSTTHGFGLQQANIAYSSVRPFYMNIEMPTLCIIGEQIGIRISLFNFMPHEIEVIIILAKSFDYKFVQVGKYGLVSAYNPTTVYGEHHHLVLIRPFETSIVYMPIVAQRLGDINVTIIAKTQIAKDMVTRTIHVEADGIPQLLHTAIVLDLSQGAYLIKYLDTNITDTPIIPYRVERRYVYGSNRASVSIFGDVVGPAFPTMPMNASSMLRKPSACGEQNMFDFAVNMYTLLYLRLTGQRKSEIEKTAFRYLNIQYQRQLSYQNKDGSFRAFRWNDRPSVWLTAFCARILHKATFQEWENFLYIDPDIISKAISWLLQFQSPDGSFYETSLHPYDRKMNTSTKITNDNVRYRNISLTAHVLITLAEVTSLRGEVGAKASNAKSSAQRYLERMVHIAKNFEDPFDLAIVTYALTLVNSVEGEEAFNLLDSRMREVNGMKYWGREAAPGPRTQIENNRPYIFPRYPHKYDSLNVETTAYALMVHIAKQAVIQKEIVEWLNTNRLHNGGWSSTQDTIVALQALIEYSLQSRLRDVTDIEVVIDAPSSLDFELKRHVVLRNVAELQTQEIPHAYGPITVKAQGSGFAVVQLDVQYNVDWSHMQIPPPVKAFDLSVSYRAFGRNNSHITYQSCQRWTLINESSSSGMAVLEVTIPSGYFIQQQELDIYVKSGGVRNLEEAKYTERKVIFYFNYLDQSATCVKFTVQRWWPVANLTRFMPARVYDYYAPERYNETIIDSRNLYLLSICDVCGSYQCPYCPIYSGSVKLNVNFMIILFFVTLAIYNTISAT